MGATYPLHIYFPKKAKPGSEYFGKEWEQIQQELIGLLKSDTVRFPGFTSISGEGSWEGEDDDVEVVLLNVKPSVVQDLSDPRIVSNDARRFLAAIAKLSCVSMGQSEFHVSVNNQRTFLFTSAGFHLSEGIVITFADILT